MKQILGLILGLVLGSAAVYFSWLAKERAVLGELERVKTALKESSQSLRELNESYGKLAALHSRLEKEKEKLGNELEAMRAFLLNYSELRERLLQLEGEEGKVSYKIFEARRAIDDLKFGLALENLEDAKQKLNETSRRLEELERLCSELSQPQEAEGLRGLLSRVLRAKSHEHRGAMFLIEGLESLAKVLEELREYELHLKPIRKSDKLRFLEGLQNASDSLRRVKLEAEEAKRTLPELQGHYETMLLAAEELREMVEEVKLLVKELPTT